MSLEIIIGKNKTGKTYYLEEIKKNNDKVLYIPAEIDLEEIIKKENIGTTAKPIISPHWKILNFINEILFPNDLKLEFSEEQKIRIKDSEKIVTNFNEKINSVNDEYFEDFFKNFLKLKANHNSNIPYNFLSKEMKKDDFKKTSSGSLNYSLIKFLYEIIFHEDFQLSNEYKIIIDEIEKFSHPEMIFKISDMISEISKKIDIVVTTHSPLFLERILFNHKNYIKDEKDFSVEYKIFTKVKEEPFLLDNTIIEEILETNNYREVSNLSKILFSSNVFLVEGINDQNLIHDLISSSSKYENTYYTIIDCCGKRNVEKAYDNICQLKIDHFFHICLFYDSDGDTRKISNSKNIIQIINNPNLEERFFKTERTKDYKNRLMIKTHKELINKNNIHPTKKWILENTTKNDAAKEIEKLEKEIDIFFNQ